jgi:hypothetical protein
LNRFGPTSQNLAPPNPQIIFSRLAYGATGSFLAGISSDAFTISLINFWKSFRPGAGMMMEFRLKESVLEL